MRRDDPFEVWAGSEKPDYDVTVPELNIKYFIGPEGDPDAVLLVQANGEFLVDEALRDEIRQLAAIPQPADYAELDVQERHYVLMGGPWYDFLIWLIQEGGDKALEVLVSCDSV